MHVSSDEIDHGLSIQAAEAKAPADLGGHCRAAPVMAVETDPVAGNARRGFRHVVQKSGQGQREIGLAQVLEGPEGMFQHVSLGMEILFLFHTFTRGDFGKNRPKKPEVMHHSDPPPPRGMGENHLEFLDDSFGT